MMSDRRTEIYYTKGANVEMEVLIAILNIAIYIFSALLLIVGALNLAGLLQQIKAGEEDFKNKLPTFLNLVGTTVLGIAGTVGVVAANAESIQKTILAFALMLLLTGTYLGLRKHAVRYLGKKGEPLKVSFAGTHAIRKKLKKKGIHTR
jgi:hypothetical protein